MFELADEYVITYIVIRDPQSNMTAKITLATDEKAAMYIKAAFELIAAADEPPEPTMMLPPLLVAVAAGASARLATGIDIVWDAF